MLEWMRWSEENEEKISEKALEWLTKNNITQEDMDWAIGNMSIEQTMNYIERQRRESYPCMSPKGILCQYGDYMDMTHASAVRYSSSSARQTYSRSPIPCPPA